MFESPPNKFADSKEKLGFFRNFVALFGPSPTRTEAFRESFKASARKILPIYMTYDPTLT